MDGREGSWYEALALAPTPSTDGANLEPVSPYQIRPPLSTSSYWPDPPQFKRMRPEFMEVLSAARASDKRRAINWRLTGRVRKAIVVVGVAGSKIWRLEFATECLQEHLHDARTLSFS